MAALNKRAYGGNRTTGTCRASWSQGGGSWSGSPRNVTLSVALGCGGTLEAETSSISARGCNVYLLPNVLLNLRLRGWLRWKWIEDAGATTGKFNCRQEKF